MSSPVSWNAVHYLLTDKLMFMSRVECSIRLVWLLVLIQSLIVMSLWYHGTLCSHSLPALMGNFNNWSCSAASRHTTTPVSHARSL